MEAVRVAFQGERGAYSEEAIVRYFGTDAASFPCRTLRDVFARVEERGAQYGVVPAENSLEGTVTQTYDLLLESSLKIRGEIKVRISHCLLVLPGTRRENLKVVFSHPQALAQCSAFLRSLKVDVEPAYDTAGSAKMLKEKQLRDGAAIASERAGTIYGLTVLYRNIEDNPENTTRFLVIGFEDSASTGADKTTVVFATKHTPGALHKALAEFADRGINLTRIESRPIRTTPWEYNFFVDFEGHREDKICAEALRELNKSTLFLKVMGSYPRASYKPT